MKGRIWLTALSLLLIMGILSPSVGAQEKVGNKTFREVKDFKGGHFDGTHKKGSNLVLNRGKLHKGTDTSGRYHGGDYYYGRWTAPVDAVDFDEAIASWQAVTPEGTWVEVELRARTEAGWTGWYSMGVWHSNDQPFQRHSVSGQRDEQGRVATDTLVMNHPASQVQARVTLFTEDRFLSPTLRSFGIAFSRGENEPGKVPFRGVTSSLDVPMRSQMIYPDGGEVWCSPTSTSMVMAYWANVTGKREWNQPVPTVVKGVWDYVYDGGGNWPYNTAYAASRGLEGKVVRMESMAEMERWVEAGVPVIISLAFKEGELTGSPIKSSGGHLLVVRGFDKNGDVLVNDPAGPADEQVRFTYKRAELEKLWLKHSNGTTYLIHPPGWKTPK
ncbi:peptidase C39 family protein [Kroppenstedtia eburnea]|uniref:peptidase C39 family protein n=1 Tax=Kroppenstedtia eburnea TaxID=714067 RepID=UPI00363B92AE